MTIATELGEEGNDEPMGSRNSGQHLYLNGNPSWKIHGSESTYPPWYKLKRVDDAQLFRGDDLGTVDVYHRGLMNYVVVGLAENERKPIVETCRRARTSETIARGMALSMLRGAGARTGLPYKLGSNLL